MIWQKNGSVKIKYKRTELQFCSDKTFCQLCDHLYEKVDCIYKLLELEKVK